MMKVIAIEIEDLEFDVETEMFEGHVALTVATPNKARTVELHFICRINRPQDCPESIITYSLIADALRQARRIPGFCRGEDDLHVVAPAPRVANLPWDQIRTSA